MDSLKHYFFDPDYIKTYNKMNLGIEKYNLYIEDSSDLWFWESFIEKYYPNKYNISTLVNRGKRSLEPHYHEAKYEAIIAVDSDFDYLISNTQYSDTIRSNPYLLHTYAYNKESALLEKNNINSFFSSMKYTIPHNIDFSIFINKLSDIIFNGLVLFVYFSNNHSHILDEKSFHKCFHLTKKKIIKTDSSGNPQINFDILIEIPQNFENFFSPYSISVEEKEQARENLLMLGVNPENAYRFINGHRLEELVLVFQKQLTDSLFSLETKLIKKDFKGKQIAERLDQIRKELSEQFQLKTHLRRYPICENDEIHQKIIEQIQLMKVDTLI